MADRKIAGPRGEETVATRLCPERSSAAQFDILIHTLARYSADRSRSKIQALTSSISELIERGFWRPGERLPTEKELSKRLHLSVGTIQAAMRALQNANLVERSRRSGTFVAQAREQGPTIWYLRFRAPDRPGLLSWKTESLSVEEVTGEGEWSRFLGPCASFIEISRVFSVADQFQVWSALYIDGNRFSPLLNTPTALLADRNLRVYLHEHFNAPIFRAIHRISACEIGEDLAEKLSCRPGDVGIRVKALSYSFRDTPISYHDMVIPPNPYELELPG